MADKNNVFRRFGPRAHGKPRPAEAALSAHDRLVEELPEEDLPEDLSDLVDLYEWGSRPRCEEREYLDRVREALDGAED